MNTGQVGVPVKSGSLELDTRNILAYLQSLTAQKAQGFPAGTLSVWPDAVAPAGTLLADGSAVSRTSYPALFAAISVRFGIGDGSTTFNLPSIAGPAAGTSWVISF